MKEARDPPNEAERLRALFDYRVLDTESIRVCRRLIILRELANEQEIKIFPRSPRARSSYGFDIRA